MGNVTALRKGTEDHTAVREAGRRVCVSSGMETELRNRIRTLRALREGVLANAKEMERAASDYAYARRVEVGLLLVKYSAELIIDLAAPRAFSFSYGRAMNLLDASMGNMDTKKALENSVDVKLDGIGEHLKNTAPGSPAHKIISGAQRLYKAAGLVQELRSGTGGGTGIDAARRTSVNLARTFARKITELERQLEECGRPTSLPIGPV